jgi:hypothetical protein
VELKVNWAKPNIYAQPRVWLGFAPAIGRNGNLAAEVSITVKNPTTRVIREPDMFIVGICSGRCDENQFAPWAKLALGNDLQLLSNAAASMGLANGEIRQIAGVMEICHRPGNAHQFAGFPGTYGQIAVCEHAFHALPIMDWPPFPQG